MGGQDLVFSFLVPFYHSSFLAFSFTNKLVGDGTIDKSRSSDPLSDISFVKNGLMQIGSSSRETGSAPATSPARINDNERVAELKKDVQRRRDELLLLTLSSINSSLPPSGLQEAIRIATKAQKHCKEAQQQLNNATDHYIRLKTVWNEIHRRKDVLLNLKESLSSIRRIRFLEKTISDAKIKGEHGLMSAACVRFESLNSSFPGRMDEVFVSLRSVADSVSLAVASSMRMLRASLRKSCTKFDPDGYSKCMQDFNDLGAASDFPSHVLQVFEEEATRLFEQVVALEAKSSQKVILYFSMLSSLLVQFICILNFHSKSLPEEDSGSENEQLRISLFPLFEKLSPPFRHFAKLAVRLVSGLRFSLLGQQTTALLQVFGASNSLCSLSAVRSFIPGSFMDNGLRFRARNGRNTRSGELETKSNVLQLRRGGSHSNVGREKDSQQRKTSIRRAWEQDFHQSIMKTMKGLARDCLSAAHARHAEELKMITETPESWVRVRLTEGDVQTLFRELFHGLNGNTGRVGEEACRTSDSLEAHAVVPCEELTADCVTFTTASMAMMRWISEYATIGGAMTEMMPDALGDITDIFLILLHASIDVKSRIDTPTLGSDHFLQFVEDVLLERPEPKSIESFITLECQRFYQAFMDRYGQRRESLADQETSEVNSYRWGLERKMDLKQYSLAAGRFFQTPFASDVSIVRQCVAAEGMSTFCDVIERLSSFLAEKIQGHSVVFQEDATQRMASLRSAVFLGREVRRGFYGLLAWDIIGGWQAVSAVAETCRSFHDVPDYKKGELASTGSAFVDEMMARISCGFMAHFLPPEGAEQLGLSICETAMEVVLEGFSRVRYSTHTAASSQILVDIRLLDLSLVEYTGIHPCPGRVRTEMYVKATFLEEKEVREWAEQHQRKLGLSDAHIKALKEGRQQMEIPVIEQIITP